MIAEAPGAAVIGGGFIGPVHVEALRRIGVTSSGCSDRRRSGRGARPTELAIRAGLPRPRRSALAIRRWASSTSPRPMPHHFAQVKRVLESGRHVICEKPLANSSQETRALLDAGRRAAGAGRGGQLQRPLLSALPRDPRADRAGRPGPGAVVTGSYVQDWLLYPEDYNWRVEPGGPANLRAVADIGTHWMDLAQFMSRASRFAPSAPTWRRFTRGGFGPSGRARRSRARPDTPVRRQKRSISRPTTTARSSCGSTAGARGLFHVSQVTAGRKNRLTIEIAGTEGSAAWDSESPNQLWLGSRNGPNQVLERDPALLGRRPARSAIIRAGTPRGFRTRSSSSTSTSMAGSSRAGKPARRRSFPSFADGDREVRLCEAIGRSALDRAMGRSQRPVATDDGKPWAIDL